MSGYGLLSHTEALGGWEEKVTGPLERIEKPPVLCWWSDTFFPWPRPTTWTSWRERETLAHRVLLRTALPNSVLAGTLCSRTQVLREPNLMS